MYKFLIVFLSCTILFFTNCETATTPPENYDPSAPPSPIETNQGSITYGENQGELPILGFRKMDENGDTIFHTIPDFEFMDQDSNRITNETFKDKIYLVDFFFIHCPSICPKVKAQMVRVYEKFAEEDRLVLLSHTLDIRNDTIPALKRYADKLQVETDRWHFVTGDEDAIYEMADKYFVAAVKDPTAPGGFDHSGRLILVDENRHVRAFGEGTLAESVDKLMIDIQRLLDEKR